MQKHFPCHVPHKTLACNLYYRRINSAQCLLNIHGEVGMTICVVSRCLWLKCSLCNTDLVLIGSEMTWAASGEASLPCFPSSAITWPQHFILSIRRDGWQPRATEPSTGSQVLLSWNIFNPTLKTAVAFLHLKGDVLLPSGSTNLLLFKDARKGNPKARGTLHPAGPRGTQSNFAVSKRLIWTTSSLQNPVLVFQQSNSGAAMDGWELNNHWEKMWGCRNWPKGT